MTTKESQSRDRRTVQCIESMFRVHQLLCKYAAELKVTVEGAVIVSRGKLPSADLKNELVPAVRRAGILGRVCDDVAVETSTS